jgi:hypothetical protein
MRRNKATGAAAGRYLIFYETKPKPSGERGWTQDR